MATFRRPYRRSRYQSSIVNFISQRQVYSGEDGRRDLVKGRLAQAKSLHRRDLSGHFGCVNAIEFSHGNAEWIVSGGDDRRVLVWNVQEAVSGRDKPRIMKGRHNSNVFCLSFDQSNTKIFSGGNDEQVVVHDFQTGAMLDVFPHDDVVYGLSVDPNNENVFASAADDGKVRIYDIREHPKSDDQPFCLAACLSSMHAVMYNPVEPRLLLTANNDEGVGLWDIRKPKKCLLKYGGDLGRKQRHDCMSVRVNHLGTQLIALYRRRPLMLYNIDSATPVCKFSSSQTEYLNCCTMKSCCFAGDKDQYVLSGSDLFHVFMWEVPDMHKPTQASTVYHVHSTHMLLKSHRSIVNQVRYSNMNHLLVTSGVEKVVKIWSPFSLPGGDGDLKSENSSSRPERVRYTQEQSMNIVLRQDMMHDYTNGSVEEDPHMMAFFDSLIQAGGDPWSTDDESSSDIFLHSVEVRLSEDSDERSNSSQVRGNDSVESTENSDLLTSGSTQTPVNNFLPSDSSSSSSSSMSWDDFNEQWVQRSKSSRPRDVDSRDRESQLPSSSTDVQCSQSSDTPYRARAKKAVKRLRLMRARIANSDTSDTDDDMPVETWSCDKHSSTAISTDDASATSYEKICDNGENLSCSLNTSKDSCSDEHCNLDVSQCDEHSATTNSDINTTDQTDKSDSAGTSDNVRLPVNRTACPGSSNSTPHRKYKTSTNGKGHVNSHIVHDNAESGQELSLVPNVKGDNSIANVAREAILSEEVNGNHLCSASTSSAVSADTGMVHDTTDQSTKTSFKKLKNGNVSRGHRQYRRHSSSSDDE